MASGFELIIDKSQVLNHLTIVDFYGRLKNLAISMFEWKNLPNNIPGRFIEQTLFSYGKMAFAHDKEKSYLVAKCTPNGALNYYELPVEYQLYGIDYSESFSTDDVVLIRNNNSVIPTDDMIRLYAQRLFEVERTIDVNIKQQKTPMLVDTTVDNKITMLNAYKQYDGNSPFIFGNKTLLDKSMTVLKTDAPYLADKLIKYKHELWNECMTALGINNANTDKRERLITDEVNANNGLVELSGQVMLLTRQEACKEINEKYGLNVSVDLRVKPPEPDKTPDDKKEVKKDG